MWGKGFLVGVVFLVVRVALFLEKYKAVTEQLQRQAGKMEGDI